MYIIFFQNMADIIIYCREISKLSKLEKFQKVLKKCANGNLKLFYGNFKICAHNLPKSHLNCAFSHQMLALRTKKLFSRQKRINFDMSSGYIIKQLLLITFASMGARGLTCAVQRCLASSTLIYFLRIITFAFYQFILFI